MKIQQKEPQDLDELDIQLLKLLQKDGRLSYTELAEMLNTTVGTVRNRVQRVMDQDILKIVGVLNPFITGMPSVAMFGMKVTMNKLQAVIDQLVEIPEVRFVAASTGRYDLFVEVITTSNVDLYRIIKEEFSKIDGIESTESSMFLEIHKQSYDWGVG
ncbi:Lrp/AsnC family transcriptional regulator [Bacillus sp. es.034]|uniref:Lrp/AsnC family transcriptional regulator n=1 Tax=Bacillus sp. es.034 TaxID=1761763 RepID=UPI000BF85462|nr:Lrp/AsnC family transcriptional regulator [Bacillus sp. es.034]PFG04510.1 Lrp/AsnC family transcriptional regulator for asnA, asnC and gidA [Bacillus sp. es.034]